VRDKIINQVPIIFSLSVWVRVRPWLIHPFFLAAGEKRSNKFCKSCLPCEIFFALISLGSKKNLNKIESIH